MVLVGDEPRRPYTRPPLSKEVLDGATSRRRELPCEELDVEWRLGTPATALDVAARTVTIGDEPLSYETLIVATGTRARTWPGETGPNVFTLRDRDDAIALRRRSRGPRASRSSARASSAAKWHRAPASWAST